MLRQQMPSSLSARSTPNGAQQAAGGPPSATSSIDSLNAFLKTTNSIVQAKVKVEACLREGRCVPLTLPPSRTAQCMGVDA
jgi:hypothetical protein